MNIFQRIKTRIQNAFYSFTEKLSSTTNKKPNTPTSNPTNITTFNPKPIQEESILPITINDIPDHHNTPITASQLSKSSPIIPEHSESADLLDYTTARQSILDQANERLSQFENYGIHSVAEMEAWENGGYFTFFNSETLSDAVNEVRRALVFLNNPGSTLEGAKIENIELSSEKYVGLFGKNRQNSIASGLIDENITKRAYEQYRKLESLKAFFVQTVADSSKLIAAMYKWELEGEDSLILASEYIDNLYRQKQNEAMNKFNNEEV